MFKFTYELDQKRSKRPKSTTYSFTPLTPRLSLLTSQAPCSMTAKPGGSLTQETPRQPDLRRYRANWESGRVKFGAYADLAGMGTCLDGCRGRHRLSLRMKDLTRTLWCEVTESTPCLLIIQRVLKINASTQSLVERLCEFKIYAVSVLSFIGSACAPDKATLKTENHALHCTTAGPYNAVPSDLFGVGSVCGLGPDLVGIHSISLAAR